MFVRLWAVPNEHYGVCMGVCASEKIEESFLGTDVIGPQMDRDAAMLAEVWKQPIHGMEDLNRIWKLENRLDAQTRGQLVFPDLHGTSVTTGLAVSIAMGSTGWSCSEWRCTFNDLTAAGQSLYTSIAEQFPECTLHLATFLDT